MNPLSRPRVEWPKLPVMLANPLVESKLDETAEAIADNVRAWGEQHEVTGAYKNGVRVDKRTSRDGRPVRVVTAGAPHSALLEYGTARGGDAYAPVRSGAEAAGYVVGPSEAAR